MNTVREHSAGTRVQRPTETKLQNRVSCFVFGPCTLQKIQMFFVPGTVFVLKKVYLCLNPMFPLVCLLCVSVNNITKRGVPIWGNGLKKIKYIKSTVWNYFSSVFDSLPARHDICSKLPDIVRQSEGKYTATEFNYVNVFLT